MVAPRALPAAANTAGETDIYLDRAFGSAIRRVRTGSPGHFAIPIVIPRVPRERMIDSGIAGSLIHGFEHQSAALLDLLSLLQQELRGLQQGSANRDL